MRPALADMKAFRAEVIEALCRANIDPRNAEWMADLFLAKLRFSLAGKRIPTMLAGKRIPTMKWFTLQDKEAEAAKLIHLGAATVAERLGCSRSQAYRRAKRHRDAA